MSFLNIPALQMGANLALIPAQKDDINILMLSCFFSAEEIDSPSTGNPPGNRERRKEPRNILWLSGLSCPKMIRLICHNTPTR
jgi:hypothetical protein